MHEEPVIGDWIRECVLGEGGFGVITLWKNAKNENSIAVKKCRWGLEVNLSPRQRERWINEVEMIKQIDHPNIIKFQELPEILKHELLKNNPSRLPLLSMEYCTKGDLRKMLSSPENCCGLLETDVRYILSDLLHGLSFLHSKGITHRDLKPENVVLQVSDTRPNNIVYKIIDLGYAKEINSKYTCASFVGTLHYLAPEILFGNAYNCSVDYWSFGIVAFEIICGVRPVPQNKALVQWLMDIKKKTSDQICVYEEADGNIKYSSEMFSENHVSGYFKTKMEKWLQLALEFDSQQRGYKQANKEKVNPDIFTELGDLLDKKCVTLFSAFTYDFLSYEIDDSTLFSTLQVWYERDTKIAIEDQIWLTKTCRRILPGEDVYALQCFDETYPGVMIFVFKNPSVIQLKEFQPEFPFMAKLIFESNHSQQKLHQLKLCFSHILYFVYKQNKYYNTLLVAWRTMVLYLCNNTQQIATLCKIMNDDKNILLALQQFSNDCLAYDCKESDIKTKDGQFLNNEIWTKNFDHIKSQILPIAKAVEHIVKRFESNNRRILELQVSFTQDYSPSAEHDMNSIFDKTLECYKMSIQKANDKIISSSCRELKKHFVDCLEYCEKMLFNIDLQTKLRHILDINIEQQIIMKTINNCLMHLSTIKQKLFEDHIMRQSQIWKCVNNDHQLEEKENLNLSPSLRSNENTKVTQELIILTKEAKNVEFPQIYENVQFDSGKCPDTSLCTDELNNPQYNKTSILCENLNGNGPNNKQFYSLPPVCSTNKLFHFPAMELVDENVALRYQVQEKTNESFLKVKSIMNENLNFDFLQNSL